MNAGTGVWVPLLAGESAARTLSVVEAIARDLSELPGAPGPSLVRGEVDLALFFAYVERALGRAEDGERAGHHLERAVDQLAVQAVPAANLFGGFAGVAWVTEHLAAGELTAEDEDPNAEIDEALLSILRRSPWREEFDLVGGLVGWGVYALERLPRPSAAAMLPLVIARLAERAEPGARGIVWHHPQAPGGEADPGMAHGAAGVIALLVRIFQEGEPAPQVAPLLAAAVDGVLAREDEDPGQGDVAWCAGNAGLSAALLAAARALDRDDWERTARRFAAAAAARYAGISEGEGFDPALCHGTAGLSHLFHRLYQATGDPALQAAAHRWLERTLARRRPGEGIGGYLCRTRLADGRSGWAADPGFLGGAAGIGLALLAAASPLDPAWDRLLLLSGRLDRQP
ncbi:MAG TPA: lanthionine synthetase LanC family protein [Thermoanaerobaculia bacterium]|nr:lanthionine synthetase LanC family protein [Thermoanaerobaculia bacterium]